MTPGNLGLVETGSVWDVWVSGSPAARRQDKVHFPQAQKETLEDNPMGGCGCSCDSAGHMHCLPVPTTLPAPGSVSEEVSVFQFRG